MGICSQDYNQFYCDCGTTGYTGAVCHVCECCVVIINHKISSLVWVSVSVRQQSKGSLPVGDDQLGNQVTPVPEQSRKT